MLGMSLSLLDVKIAIARNHPENLGVMKHAKGTDCRADHGYLLIGCLLFVKILLLPKLR